MITIGDAEALAVDGARNPPKAVAKLSEMIPARMFRLMFFPQTVHNRCCYGAVLQLVAVQQTEIVAVHPG